MIGLFLSFYTFLTKYRSAKYTDNYWRCKIAFFELKTVSIFKLQKLLKRVCYRTHFAISYNLSVDVTH